MSEESQHEEDPKKRLMMATMAYLEQGHTPTTRELARQADVNIAAINYYFQGKDNLIAQALDEDELRQVRKLFDHCLTNHTVTWTTSQVFLVAKFGESTVSTT